MTGVWMVAKVASSSSSSWKRWTRRIGGLAGIVARTGLMVPVVGTGEGSTSTPTTPVGL